MLKFPKMQTALKTNYEPLFTIREVASIFKLSPAAVRQLIQKQELAAIRIGKQFRVPQSIVDDYFRPFQQPHPLPGFGILKGRVPQGIAYENRMREKTKHQTLEAFLDELKKIK